MYRLVAVAVVAAVLVMLPGSYADPPRPADAKNPGVALPVGKWKVEFSNGVKEACDIGNGGEASVVEPLRQSGGTAEMKNGVVVLTFNDDRVERWTPVGARYVVEHWFPASKLPTVAPVLGIGEKAE